MLVAVRTTEMEADFRFFSGPCKLNDTLDLDPTTNPFCVFVVACAYLPVRCAVEQAFLQQHGGWVHGYTRQPHCHRVMLCVTGDVTIVMQLMPVYFLEMVRRALRRWQSRKAQWPCSRASVGKYCRFKSARPQARPSKENTLALLTVES